MNKLSPGIITLMKNSKKIAKKEITQNKKVLSNIRNAITRPDGFDDPNKYNPYDPINHPDQNDKKSLKEKNLDAIDRSISMIADVDSGKDLKQIVYEYPELYLNYPALEYLRKTKKEGVRRTGEMPMGNYLIGYYDLIFDREEIDKEFYFNDDLPPYAFPSSEIIALKEIGEMIRWKKSEEKNKKSPTLERAKILYPVAFEANFGMAAGEFASHIWKYDPDLRPFIQEGKIRSIPKSEINNNRREWAIDGIHWWHSGRREETIERIKNNKTRAARRMN